MPGYLHTIIVAMLLSQQAVAQDDSVDDTPSDAPEVESAAEVEEIDDADLDEQTYEQDEDDFVPTEEIPADEAIPFPTNI